MRKLFVTPLVMAAVLAAAPAVAEESFYVGGSLAASSVSDYDFKKNNPNSQTRTIEFDSGFGLDGRVGYDAGAVRVELELGFRGIDVDSVSPGSNASGDLNAYTAMLNGAYDLELESDFTPYIGIGIGALIVEGDVAYTSSSDGTTTEDKNFYGAAPAAQIGIGTAYAISESVDLIGGYDLLGAQSDDGNEDNVILMHSVTFGLNVNF
ncbi:MAG: outer membrane beta-barrel protein [Alphaproteobacteria bacterium]